MCKVDYPPFFCKTFVPFFRALSLPEMLVQFETAMKDGPVNAARRVEVSSTGRVLLASLGKPAGFREGSPFHPFQTLWMATDLNIYIYYCAGIEMCQNGMVWVWLKLINWWNGKPLGSRSLSKQHAVSPYFGPGESTTWNGEIRLWMLICARARVP